ncbi:unnamed protein product [Rhodiola kirilowii]
MELPELSLAPSICNNSSPDQSSDTGSSRKRKALSEGLLENKAVRAHRSTIDLQHSNERLPMDWEQCLDLQVSISIDQLSHLFDLFHAACIARAQNVDLVPMFDLFEQSGKMYFLNRKTLKKSWDRPSTKDHHKLDLELNISSPKEGPVKNNSPNSYLKSFELVRVAQAIQSTRKEDHLSSLASYCCNKEFINSSNNMVAMACMSCHLLVIVSKSNPTCPNCKYVHCIPPDQQISPAPTPSNPTFKPLDTLSLFS